MESRKLAVEGAYGFTPRVFSDSRGFFVSPFEESAFADAVGHPLFPVAQASCGLSRRGVVRGIHFTATPPGQAKYVYCLRGKAIDVVVDLRAGSPTFGRWDSVLVDEESCRAIYLPVGAGHVYIALADDTVMSYILSEAYVPENELAVSVLDPRLGLPIPDDIEPIMSDRDRNAPPLAEAADTGLLPDYHKCLEIEASFGDQAPR